MAEGKWTAGQWRVSPFRAQVTCQRFGKDGDFLPVAQMLWPTDERSEAETYANAHLIAAAPDSYDFAAAHDAYMLDAGYFGPDDSALHPKAAENWRRCRAFMARARGEQS